MQSSFIDCWSTFVARDRSEFNYPIGIERLGKHHSHFRLRFSITFINTTHFSIRYLGLQLCCSKQLLRADNDNFNGIRVYFAFDHFLPIPNPSHDRSIDRAETASLQYIISPFPSHPQQGQDNQSGVPMLTEFLLVVDRFQEH